MDTDVRQALAWAILFSDSRLTGTGLANMLCEVGPVVRGDRPSSMLAPPAMELEASVLLPWLPATIATSVSVHFANVNAVFGC